MTIRDTLSGEPKVLEHRAHATRAVLRVHYRFTADLPSAATRVIDPRKLTWVEETTYDLAARTSRSKLLPDHYPDRLTASAVARFTEAGTGTERRIEGDLKVRMPLVGGKVETLREGVELSAAVIDDGRAKAALQGLKRITNS